MTMLPMTDGEKRKLSKGKHIICILENRAFFDNYAYGSDIKPELKGWGVLLYTGMLRQLRESLKPSLPFVVRHMEYCHV